MLACAVLRLSHFGAAGAAGATDLGYVAMYLIPILASLGAAYLILSGKRLTLPEPLARLVDAMTQVAGQLVNQLRGRVISLMKWRTAS